ncbi:putative ubiquitin associated and SH3 domain-containing protein A [Aphelenchoides bicaudatus]|nr:putative ubiquitin associated and SH3 domain-containing protein A [Aphelenchoides bicaudatus]
MPLGIDLVFKWGNQNKKEKKPPEKKLPKKPSSSSSSESCPTCKSTRSSKAKHSSCKSAASKAKSKKVEKVKKLDVQGTQSDTCSDSTKKAYSKRLLIFVRHAERMDRTFPSWLRLANVNRKYRPYDKNQPPTLPKRNSPVDAFLNDPPLTLLGQSTAAKLGKSIDDVKIQPAFIYCSPALRCIETANHMLKSLRTKIKIRIEPGLFDWLGFYMDKLPVFMSTQELQDAGFEIDHNYKSILSIEKLLRNRGETSENFYNRISNVTSRINSSSSSGTVLIVSHAITIDAGVRSLLKLSTSIASFHILDTLSYRYPYASTFILQEDDDGKTFKEGKALPDQESEDFGQTISAPCMKSETDCI